MALFPELSLLRRTATRLHPRPGTPSRKESSIGGPLLWPADDPWPHCARPHQEFSVPPMTLAGVARYRALQAERWERGDAQFTEAESAELQQIGRGTAIPNDPIALLPVAQLYVPEVPDLQGRGPAGSDLLQVPWCPFDHLQDEEYQPKTALYWRDSTRITDILTDPPQPAAVMLEDYVPEPCVLDPEQIIEYPSSHALDPALRERITAWDPEENGNGNDPAPARPRIRHAGLRMLQRDRPPHDRLLALTPAQHDKPHLPYLLVISESGGQVPACAWCVCLCVRGPRGLLRHVRARVPRGCRSVRSRRPGS